MAQTTKLIIEHNQLELKLDQKSVHQFLHLSKSGKLNEKLGDVRLIDTNSTPCLSDNILAFMAVKQTKHIDYYGFDITPTHTAPQHPVIVFADHAIVHHWPDFQAFVTWLQSQ